MGFDKKSEEQTQAREGAKFTPQHPEAATTKHDLDRIRSQQEIKNFNTGPTNHTSSPSG